MRKTIPILLLLGLLPLAGPASAGEIIEKTFYNTRGQPVQIKVFSTSSRPSSSRSYYHSRTRSSRGIYRNVYHHGYHPYPYGSHVYCGRGHGHRPHISVGATGSHRAISITLGR